MSNYLVSESNGKRVSELFTMVGDDIFTLLCEKEVKNLAVGSQDKLCLIAVGAGALQSKLAIKWLSNYKSIAIIANPKEVYARDRLRSSRTFEQFKAVEYSPYRITIYESANYKHAVDGLDLAQASAKLLDLLTDTVLTEI